MRIKPDYNLKSIYDINLDELKSLGIKVILFDLDSTLMVSKSAKFLPETTEWLHKVMQDFKIAIISNNTKEEYLAKVRSSSDFDVIGCAKKPNPDKMREYLNTLNLKPEDAVMVGDRPLTDILAGKFLGCKTILVDSINADRENLPTRLVRKLERITIKK